MNNLIKTTAVIAMLFTGTAAIAQGGYVDELGYINAATPMAQARAEIEPENANATSGEIEIRDRTGKSVIPVTVFLADTAATSDASKGR